MRRIASLLLIACAAVVWAGAVPAYAQYGGRGGGGGGGGGDDEETAKTRKRNEEWGTGGSHLALPTLRNAGPCPFVKVLYDAARYIELKDNKEATQAVGFTGEIQGLSSACEYKGADPIKVQARLLFALGRGPQAEGAVKTYHYWIAVTDRDRAVIQKAEFELPVTFPAGRDRVEVTQDVMGITIPRASARVSGTNFEVLVGFDVTPEMAEFNRQGKRFLANAGASAQP
ncbi:MAG: Tat pathway signal sequence domain protein [Caulobacteraceae bacterium]|nr:Tat pathway signal sequence domain protein [Caulobacteraceae bacterium]